jgi:hypothetical protein
MTNKLKRTTEEVAKYFEANGCKLIGEYYGAQIKMEYICSCGEKGNTSWNNFTNGKRCGKCQKWGLAHKKSLDEIKKIFSDRGCQFLDYWYGGIHTSHNYICKCGRVSQISFAGFHHQNQNCKECGKEKNKGENHHMWRSDREQFKYDKLFRKKMYKSLSSTLLNFGKQKVGRTSDMLGYGPKELQEHITNHSNWEKVKNTKWHLDHIFPIQAFLDYNIYKPDLINCLENIQPLGGKENVSKHAKYNKNEFESWLKSKSIPFTSKTSLEQT